MRGENWKYLLGRSGRLYREGESLGSDSSEIRLCLVFHAVEIGLYSLGDREVLKDFSRRDDVTSAYSKKIRWL